MPKSNKAFKPSPQLLHTIQTLQNIAEDESAWRHNLPTQLTTLHTALHKLSKLQSIPFFRSVIPNRTTTSLQAFLTWLSTTHNLPLSQAGLTLSFVPGTNTHNATLYATRPIARDDHLVSIPSSLMLTSLFPSSRPSLTTLAAHLPALQTSPSLALVVALLSEAALPQSSPHAPYIAVLPAVHPIPFATFQPAHTLALKPSPAAAQAVRALRAQVRDYTHIFRAVVRLKPADLPLSVLSFDNWRWAVSVVMTRQNAVPIPPGWRHPSSTQRNQPQRQHQQQQQQQQPSAIMALVPLWDMFNHEGGKPTTAVLMRADDITVECRAMRDFKTGEAVTMCYGHRSNIQLALYSGFVQKDNPHDELPLTLALPSSAPLAALKARLLSKRGIKVRQVGEGDDGEGVGDTIAGWEGDGWACNVSVKQGVDAIDEAAMVAGVIVMEKEALAAFLKQGEDSPIKIDSPDSLRLLESALAAKLAQYGEGGRGERSAGKRDGDGGGGDENSGADFEGDAAYELVNALQSEETTLLLNAVAMVRSRLDGMQADVDGENVA